jgi:hypothetical protein
MLMTLILEWVFQLGSIHLHKLLLLPVCEKGTVQRLAELALISIYKSPEAMLMLMTLDVLFIDELGQWSDGYIAVVDIILRHIRGSNAFLEASKKGLGFLTLTLLTPLMITSFKFLNLGHSVRAGGDPNLQRIQNISRMDSQNYTPEITNEFKQLLLTSCTFISDWDSPTLEQSVIHVIGLHDAVKHAEVTMLQRIKDSNVTVLSCSARDKQISVTAHSDWGSASDAIRRQLDKKCKEPRVLHFYPNALYEMTYNDSALGFSQSQIAMLQEMPTAEEIRSFSPVELLLAPSGCKTIPEGVEQPNDLLHYGWRGSYLLVRLEGP